MDKLLNDFRDYGGEQNGDHADSDQRQYDGVDHRLQQAGAELLALLGIVSKVGSVRRRDGRRFHAAATMAQNSPSKQAG